MPSSLTAIPWRCRAGGVIRSPGKPIAGLAERPGLCGKALGAPRADAAEAHPDRRQPLIGVVGAQDQPVLGARGEHPVGLAGAAGDEIVDQYADIGVGAVEHERLRPRRRERRVEPGDQPLRRRLLVAGRAVDLAGEDRGRAPAGSPGSDTARAGRRNRIRSRSPAAALPHVRGPGWCATSPPARRAAGRSRCRSGRSCRRRAPPARERSGAGRARQSGRSCPRSTGNSAARCR